MTDIYLTKELKNWYMEDFAHVLQLENEFWKLEACLKDIMIDINRNSLIQTLYSSRTPKSSPNQSYLKFCYSEDCELHLLRDVIPELLIVFNNLDSKSYCFYTFHPPTEKPNSTGEINLSLSKCANDEDYFRINHLNVVFKSRNLKEHNRFWEKIRELLVNLS